MALDESVDVTDVSQLMIFARLVDESFEVKEELLTLHPLTGGRKGSDIYEALNFVVSSSEVSKNVLAHLQMAQRPW